MHSTTDVRCPRCGQILPGNARFCAECGMQLGEAPWNNQAFSPAPPQTVPQQRSFLQRHGKKIGIAVAVIAAVLITVFAVNAIQASNLKKQLQRGWSRVEGDDGVYIECILDFSDDEITYRLEPGYRWMDMTVATYDYKVISGNKIKVLRYGDWETVKVEFNKDKTMMTVTPALTSADREECWFRVD